MISAAVVGAPRLGAAPRPGPYTVLIVRIIEGDHFDARVRIRNTTNSRWDERMRLRLSNARTPKSSSERECETVAAEEVREFIRGHIRGKRLQARDLRNVRQGKEMVARLEVDGEDLGELLIAKGMAVPYEDVGDDPADRPWECK